MNAGLATLQFQSLSLNTQNPLDQIMGGTQDNGTQAFGGGDSTPNPSWFVTFFGDGGNGGIVAADKPYQAISNRCDPVVQSHPPRIWSIPENEC